MARKVVILLDPKAGTAAIREKKDPEILKKLSARCIGLALIAVSAFVFTSQEMITQADLLSGTSLLFIGLSMLVGGLVWR